MDERRARIYDDLRGIVAGELYFEPLDRAPFAHDASLYEIDPLGVVVPRTEDDVVTVVRYAAEHRIPLHARGAGTDTGGGSLGPGLVIDFSRHLRRVVADHRRSGGRGAGRRARGPQRRTRSAGPPRSSRSRSNAGSARSGG